MRIIAGEYRGRKLESPKTNDVRPTTDKVKEAMFSILMPYINGARCLDLFSGTGSLGLEALSRGAENCVFCDNSREHIALIKENIKKCGAESKSKVIHGDYMKALEHSDDKYDIILVDPPYGAGLYEKCLASIEKLDLLEDEGIIILEHEKNVVLPDCLGKYSRLKEKKYGTIHLSFYAFPNSEETE